MTILSRNHLTLFAAISTLAFAAGTAQSATQRPGLYWSKATITAAFNYTLETQQVGRIIPDTAQVTVSCQGLARSDGIHGAADYLVTPTGGRRFRYFVCTALSSCWFGGKWQVHYSVLLDATASPATNVLRVRRSQVNVPQPNPDGC